MQIVPMHVSHLKEIMEIEQESFGADSWSVDSFLSELNSKYTNYVSVIDQENKVVGYAGCRILLDEAEIVNICVRSDYRGLGIGSKILEYYITLWKEKNIKYAFLEVRVSNSNAINLYKKFGFEIISLRKEYYSNQEDAYVMALDINKLLNGS